MRGSDAMQESLFMVAKVEDFVPGDDSLRGILELVNDALRGLMDCLMRSMLPADAIRLRRRNWFGHCCCRYSIRCAASGN